VYKASFSGALKTLLDLFPERALEGKVVLPFATGGTIAHMLAVDYALKPVLSALKAQEICMASSPMTARWWIISINPTSPRICRRGWTVRWKHSGRPYIAATRKCPRSALILQMSPGRRNKKPGRAVHANPACYHA
jgi:hypothetical protein